MMRYSVVIPCYNSAGTLGRAIRSVLAQTLPPDEVVIVDDGSVDDPAAVVNGFSSPVRLVRQENAGPGSARNRGVRETTAPWVAFLDSDDAWLPEKMRRQQRFTGNPAVGVVHASALGERHVAPAEVSFQTLWKQNCVYMSSAVVRRAALDSVGGFDERPELICVEDLNLWMRIASAGWTIATCAEQLIEYTRTPSSLSFDTVRLANALLANADLIGKSFGLDATAVRRRAAEIRLSCGLVLINDRELRAARAMVWGALRSRPTLTGLGVWSSTFVPVALLNLRRRRLAETD